MCACGFHAPLYCKMRCYLFVFLFSELVDVTAHIFLISKSVSTLFWASDTFSSYDRLEFVNFKLMRLVVYDVTALAWLFNASSIYASSTLL